MPPFLTVGAAAPLQEAAVTGLHMPDSYYQWLQDKYTHKRNLFLKGLEDIGIPHTDPQGAYFVLADIGPYMRKGESDVDFCLEMATQLVLVLESLLYLRDAAISVFPAVH